MLEENTIIPDNIITINNYKEGCEKSVSFKVRIDEIRTIRNKLFTDSDYYLLPDISLEENKLNEIQVYRQHLRDFMNKLMNDEIVCDIFDDEFETKIFFQVNSRWKHKQRNRCLERRMYIIRNDTNKIRKRY